MKFRRKLAAVLAGIITVTAFSGCSMLGNQTTNALGTYDFTQMDLVQLNKPSEGQDVAVIETNLGTITAVLYAEFAPKTVANFKKRAEEGFFGPVRIDGPLDLKTSCSPAALKAKNMESCVEGDADAVIVPDIEAGNVFYKTITLFCGAVTAGILQGPTAPVVVPSRGDSPEAKFLSIAMAAMAHQ